MTVVFDDCYLCNWLMHDGRMVVSQRESWCGAGRPEFFDDYATTPCVNRSEKVEILLPADETLELDPEVEAWIKENLPDTKIQWKVVPGEAYMLLEFTSVKAATFFKLRWDGLVHTNIA